MDDIAPKGRVYGPEPLYQFLSDNGAADGNNNVILDHSNGGSPGLQSYFILAPAGWDYVINRMIVSIEDTGSFDSGGYGNGAQLTAGFQVRLWSSAGLKYDLLNGETIKQNGQWAQTCHDVTRHNFGSGNEWLTVRWTFGLAGHPLILQGDHAESLIVEARDNLTHLVSHHFMVQGWKRPH